MFASPKSRTVAALGIGVALLALLWMVLQSSGGQSTAINVVISDRAMTADATTVAAGKVTFTIANQGHDLHELIVLRTDMAAGSLKLQAADPLRVDEDASGTVLGEVEDLLPGKSGTLTVTLAPGRYVLFCNITGHYKAGVFTAIEVK